MAPEARVNDDVINNKTPPSLFVSPEYEIAFPVYLNLYHGLDIDPNLISHYRELTPQQKVTYESFLEQVRTINKHDDGNDDLLETPSLVLPDAMTCLRFLQADKYHADKALQRIVTTMKWQQQMNLAQVMSRPPRMLETYRKIRVRACMGRTKDGMPIFVERLGAFFNGIPSAEGKTLTQEDWIHCFLYELADVLRKIRETYHHETTTTTVTQHPHPPTITWKATWIMDCQGVSAYRAMKAVSTLKMIDSVTEPNFPEMAGPIYLINVPSIVAGVWRICKAFLDPTVVTKIQIHSGVPKDILLERIDESVLFQEYGGTNDEEYPKSCYI
jgi:CRAL/TRIO domain